MQSPHTYNATFYQNVVLVHHDSKHRVATFPLFCVVFLQQAVKKHPQLIAASVQPFIGVGRRFECTIFAAIYKTHERRSLRFPM